MTELENTVKLYKERGLEWVEAKLQADLLEKDRESYLSAVIADLRKVDPEASEKKLETDAKASQQYRDYVKGCVYAKNKELAAKVSFDTIDKLFSARQSDQSLLREQVSKGIYHEGGK